MARVLVGPADDPGGRVGNAEVEDFAGLDEVVEAVHDFGDGGGEVPPVDVEKIDVAGLELRKARLQRHAQAFGVVAGVVEGDVYGLGLIGRGKFGGEDHLVAVPPRGHPLAEPGLRLLALVVVGGVEEVAAVRDEAVEHGEGGFLVAFAEEAGPGVAKVQGAETEGGDTHAGGGGEDAMVAEEALGFGSFLERHCD